MSWDAQTYEHVADPQHAWALEVLDRLALRGDERVLDAGCGGGRITSLLVERLPRGSVVAVDGDANMVAQAHETHGERVEVVHQDLLGLELFEPVDAVFSSAVFHWITDHELLFARLHAALRPGGRLAAQCGGEGNIAGVLEHVGERPGTWFYADAAGTEARLRAAGFSEVRAWLEPKPTRVADLETYLAAVILHGQPDAREVAARVAPKLDHLDYVRLNMEAVA